MRLVVIDTNVMVSAGINPLGALARLILERHAELFLRLLARLELLFNRGA